MRILVVDGERTARDALGHTLRERGYAVAAAADADEAVAALARDVPDVVILGIRRPALDGIAACRRLRKSDERVPILLLAAHDAVADRVAGLDAGADDYLVEPVAPEELQARVRALLRRAGNGDGPLVFGDLALDPGAREVRRGGREVDLTRTEFNLLELFLRNPRQVLTRALIAERIWGHDDGPASNALEVYVGYLRRKLESAGEPRLIQTVRGVGYQLREA